MRFFKIISISLTAVLFIASCGGGRKPLTPLATLETYTRATKRKDAATMKQLLSAASIKMAEQQAKEQNLPLDEIIKNETLFTENQKTVEYRNEKIEGERATVEVKNPFNSWDTVPFVFEDGVWRIDKQAFANRMMQQNEIDNQKLDDIINQGKQP